MRQSKITYYHPNGTRLVLSPRMLKKYLIENGLRIRQPSYQASSLEESQVGIKGGI